MPGCTGAPQLCDGKNNNRLDSSSPEVPADEVNVDTDADGVGNTCNDCPFEGNVSQADTDADRVDDICDCCLFDLNPRPNEFDDDGEADVCEPNDGLILILGTDDEACVKWQQEAGPQARSDDTGGLSVPRSSGVYTQTPGSNPLATLTRGVTIFCLSDLLLPDPGRVEYRLVRGATDGTERSFGNSSIRAPTPMTTCVGGRTPAGTARSRDVQGASAPQRIVPLVRSP